jgi:hypothetical protein
MKNIIKSILSIRFEYIFKSFDKSIFIIPAFYVTSFSGAIFITFAWVNFELDIFFDK